MISEERVATGVKKKRGGRSFDSCCVGFWRRKPIKGGVTFCSAEGRKQVITLVQEIGRGYNKAYITGAVVY